MSLVSLVVVSATSGEPFGVAAASPAIADPRIAEILAIEPGRLGVSAVPVGFQQSPSLRNVSLSACIGAAVDIAQGEFVVFIYGDCAPEPGWLDALLNAAESAEVGCVAGEIFTDAGASAIGRAIVNLAPNPQRRAVVGWRGCAYALLANALYRREALEQIGPFGSECDSGLDLELAARLARKTNLRLVYAPKAMVRRRAPQDVEAFWTQSYGIARGALAFAERQEWPPATSNEEIGKAVCKDLAKWVDRMIATGAEGEALVGALAIAERAAAATAIAPALPQACCDCCGGTVFQPGPGGRMNGDKPPECTGCGALERHRAMHRVLKCLPPAVRGWRALAVGEGWRASHRVFREHSHVTIASLAGVSVGDLDAIVSTGYFSTGAPQEMAEALQMLTAPISEEGVLIVVERLSLELGQPTRPRAHGVGGYEIGGDLGAAIAEHLPEVHVASCLLFDKPTNEKWVAIVASPNMRLASATISRLQANNLLAV